MRKTASGGALCALLLGAAGLAGCGGAASPPQINISAAYIPLPASPDLAAAYFSMGNSGGSDDKLLGVSSPNAQSAALNESTSTSMAAVAEVDVPAHGVAVLERGGKHVMLMGLKPTPAIGQIVDLRLTFEKSGTITVQAMVEPLTYQPPK